MDAVKHAMKRDEKDPTIMDLDHDKSLKSQQKEQATEDTSTDDGPALKDDPLYEKVGNSPSPLVCCTLATVPHTSTFTVFQDVANGTADGRREARNETRREGSGNHGLRSR